MNADLKLVAEKIMGWKCPRGCVDGKKKQVLIAHEYAHFRNIWIAQGGEPWPETMPEPEPCDHCPDPLTNDADCLELLKQLVELDNFIIGKETIQGRNVDNFLFCRPDHRESAPTLNAAIFQFAVKLAKEKK